MPVVEKLTGRTAVVNGKKLLYFCGTSYLGMSHNPELSALVQEGASRYGLTYSNSRGSTLKLAIYDEAEALLANWTGAEAALTFSSGYLAGQALIQTLDKGQAFFYAPDTHPAIWRTAADVNYEKYEAWAENLADRLAQSSGDIVIVSNSVDPLRARKYNFDWVKALPADKNITLVIDDSHGLGLCGTDGAGIYPELKQQVNSKISLIVVSSMGKALGIPAGVILGPAAIVASLKKSPYFMGGSPAPPAYLYAFTHAQSMYEQARQQLWQNVKYFQGLVRHSDMFQYFDAYPVFYTNHQALYSALENDALISCFPYPDETSEAITRVVINSMHTTGDIDFLAEKISAYASKMRVV